MAIYKVYTGKESPTREVHRTEEEYIFSLSRNAAADEWDEVPPNSVFRGEGVPEGFESETLFEAVRYANTLRKMSIYGGVWVEYLDDFGVRKIEYIHSDYCLYFEGDGVREFIEGDDFLSLRNLAEEMASGQSGTWRAFEIFDFYSGGRLLWRLAYRDWMEKENSRRNFWAVVVFLLMIFVAHYFLTH